MTTRLLLLVAALAVAAVHAHAASFDGLYATYHVRDGFQLARLNPLTGARSPIGQPHHRRQAGATATIDSINGHFYMLTENTTTQSHSLLGLSLQTGAIMSDHELPYHGNIYDDGKALDFDPITGDLIVYAKLEPGHASPHGIGRATPSGTFNLVCKMSYHDFDVSPSAYDWIHGVEWLPLFETEPPSTSHMAMFGCNTTTGAIERVAFDLSHGHNLWSMDFDPVTNSLVGVGIMGNKATANTTYTISRYEVGKKQWTVVGVISNYEELWWSARPTLDRQTRTLYAMMSRTPGTWDLVSINIDTAQVRGSLPLALKDYPGSMAFANGRAQSPSAMP